MTPRAVLLASHPRHVTLHSTLWNKTIHNNMFPQPPRTHVGNRVKYVKLRFFAVKCSSGKWSTGWTTSHFKRKHFCWLFMESQPNKKFLNCNSFCDCRMTGLSLESYLINLFLNDRAFLNLSYWFQSRPNPQRTLRTLNSNLFVCYRDQETSRTVPKSHGQFGPTTMYKTDRQADKQTDKQTGR